MFDVGWSEMLVIAVVAIVVVGPKELPRMLRTFGRSMGQVRRTANDFKRQFDEALREAERQTDLEDTKKQLQSIARMDPVGEAKKGLSATVLSPATAASATPQTVLPAAPEPQPASRSALEAEPLKTGSASSERGSDAA